MGLAQAKEKTKKRKKGPEKKTVRSESKKDRPGISATDPDCQADPTIQVGESEFDESAAADVAVIVPKIATWKEEATYEKQAEEATRVRKDESES